MHELVYFFRLLTKWIGRAELFVCSCIEAAESNFLTLRNLKEHC